MVSAAEWCAVFWSRKNAVNHVKMPIWALGTEHGNGWLQFVLLCIFLLNSEKNGMAAIKSISGIKNDPKICAHFWTAAETKWHFRFIRNENGPRDVLYSEN